MPDEVAARARRRARDREDDHRLQHDRTRPHPHDPHPRPAAAVTAPDRAPPATTTVLYVHGGGHWIRGSERCLLDLIAGVDRSRFTPVLWCDGDGLAAAAADLGVPVE